ncbi:MAG: peptidoglycan DD-metalloendopeptidase family protein [Myxococcota bacterium]
MSVDPGDDKPSLRPLPSVGMALLPNELRARRVRRWVASGAVATVFVTFVGVWVVRSLLSAEPEANAAEPATELGAVSPDPALVAVAAEPEPVDALSPEERLALQRSSPNARYETTFGGVPSFRGALLNAGLEAEECNQVEQALKHIVDFRRCRPEHKLVVERDDEGGLKSFEYHPSATEFVAVSRGADGEFRAEQIRIKVERTPIARATSVQTSIGDGLVELGLPAGLAAFFTEAFEGRINFPLQARKGDVFRILVDEERVDGEFLRYGRVHAVEYNGQKTGKQQAFFYEAPNVQAQFYDDTGRAMQGGWLRTPLRYDRLSSRFNPRRFHPILKRIMPHLGVDYAASTGTPVWAAADGRVTFAGRKGPSGNLVVIRHAGGFETLYAHLHRIKAGIRPGTQVKQRDLIGFVGSTGRSTGPHLHFGLKKHARYLDPAAELNGPGRRLPPRELVAFKEVMAESQGQLTAIPDAPALVASDDEPLVEQVDEIMD